MTLRTAYFLTHPLYQHQEWTVENPDSREFLLEYRPLEDSISVYVNGLGLKAGSYDKSLLNDKVLKITPDTALEPGDVIAVNYAWR